MRIASRMILSAIAMLALSGCAGTKPMKVICPTLVTYTKEEQLQLANELLAIGDDKVMIFKTESNYKGLRDQTRACQAGAAPKQ